MRKILFRGKRLDTEEWAYGVPLFEENSCYMLEDLIIFPKYQCTGAVNSIVDPETVGQYTGLIDKNGRKIFEGDIVRNAGNVVEFCGGAFCINGDSPLSCWTKTEVIGNIHDNPELVEGGEKD